MDVIDSDTGEIVGKVDDITEAAEMIERPPLWRKHRLYDESGDVGPEFMLDLLNAQKEMGAAIEADSSNEFNASRYTSLGYLLTKIKPILNKYNFVVSYGVGRMVVRTDLGGKMFLPVYVRLVHAPSGQYEKIPFEIPMVKFDAQSYGALLTYGRRYATETYLGLKGGADEDGVLASRDLTPADIEKMTSRMLGKIAECKSPLDLRTWAKANEQQIAHLGEEVATKLREAWEKRLGEVKPGEKKKATT